jgi:hypothetical protein
MVLKGLQSSFLQIDIAEIVIHKADEPHAVFGLVRVSKCVRNRSPALFCRETGQCGKPAHGNQDRKYAVQSPCFGVPYGNRRVP